MKLSRLIPELDVSSLDVSIKFYLEIIGCKILYERPEEQFVMLDIEGSQIMLESAEGLGRRFCKTKLEHPYGRGVNFQIEVSNVDLIYQRCLSGRHEIILPLEEKWYKAEEYELGNRQFVVADPDGYLLRFFSNLGKRLVTE
ncbi:MAG: VOC family protein [Proteobacteria bacterium]|nr:VOC family protein [Pseudomonadota bacterium]